MWYMHPITVTIDVPQPREHVYDFLDVLANHELFTDHMMRDWQFDGPPRGVGGKARFNSVLAGRTEPIELEVIAAEPPVRNVERNTGAGGRRVATGTYTLTERPEGGTTITFEYAWQRAPISERLAAPMIRRAMQRALTQAMQQLADQLQTHKLTSS
jgi:uncharacterized protein YndB with AHSA1/START domain